MQEAPEHRTHNYNVLADISSCANELFHAAEEKVNLAQATYDSVRADPLFTT